MSELSNPSIKMEHLCRDFGSFRAVDQLSLKVPSGMVFGFLGPNGAGKTTIIRMLLGLIEPTAGSAAVLGFDVQSQAAEIRSKTGTLLEHHGIYEHMTAEANLEFFGRIYHIPKVERNNRIKELLTQMDLWARRTETVGNWSRGMKQRLALARALIHKPPLLFLDEPTAGLDVMAAQAVRADIAALVARQGTTVFLTTHNMAEAEKLCSQIAVIRSGKLVAAGTPDELKSQSSHPRVRISGRGFTPELQKQLESKPDIIQVNAENSHLEITLSKETQVSNLINILLTAGAQVEEVQSGRASLEEVFLTLMEEEK